MECHLFHFHKNSTLHRDSLKHTFENPKAQWNLSLIMLLGALVFHIFIAHYHYRLHQEGLRYSHTIPRHPVGLMQHLSPGWSEFTLLWWGRCRQCGVALHITSVKTVLRTDLPRTTDCVCYSHIHGFPASSVNMARTASFDDHWLSQVHALLDTCRLLSCQDVSGINTISNCSQFNLHGTSSFCVLCDDNSKMIWGVWSFSISF